MRVAVIDCGTNTFNLLIVEVAGGKKPHKLYNTRIAVKLGEGSDGKTIGAAAFERALQALETYCGEIMKYGVGKTLAFATAAVRDADNGKLLVEEALKRFNIQIQVIAGEQEAELIYAGIKEAVRLNNTPSLIMDIGGGSNEFIIANKNTIYWRQSFNIGAARLLQRFHPSDPISAQEKKDILDYLYQNLVALGEAVKKYQPTELIGSSGAFESIIEMIHGEMGGEEFVTDRTEYEINLSDYFTISRRVVGSTLAERKLLKGLVPMRLDMIVISCLMMDFVLETYGLNRMRVSTYSLKEGALAGHLEKREE